MPKAIDAIKEKILAEAKNQVVHNGYSRMTIRSIAKECNIAVGTIYNYYSSKEMLTASFMLEDWISTLQAMELQCSQAKDIREVFYIIYVEIIKYYNQFLPLFNDTSSSRSYAMASQKRHLQLRSQIASVLEKHIKRFINTDNKFLYDFIAESILTWAIENKDFEEVNNLLIKLN